MTTEPSAQDMSTARDDAARRAERRLDSLDLSPRTTLDEIVARWGPATPTGPGDEILAYFLASGDDLWLSFTEGQPRRLVRAVLIRNHSPGGSTILFNDIERTKHRCRGQFNFTWPHGVTLSDIYAAWGPPDDIAGSGFPRWVYRMEDGTEFGLLVYRGRILNGQPGRGRRVRHEPQSARGTEGCSQDTPHRSEP
jgi:hypothetical protein